MTPPKEPKAGPKKPWVTPSVDTFDVSSLTAGGFAILGGDMGAYS